MTLTAPVKADPGEHADSGPHSTDALRWLPADLVADVALSEMDGVVLLSGRTSSVTAWRLIRETVLAASGPVVVADEIQVRGARALRGAAWTERIARSIATMSDPVGSVAVQTDDGVTTLWGRVPDARRCDEVVRAVREVIGGAWIQMRIVAG